MAGHDIICIGASAGGVEALTTVVQHLPADCPAAIFVVLHVPPSSPSVLPSILNRVGRLPARHATDGEPFEARHIYVAPPGRHLLVKRGYVRTTTGPRENASRPSVDPLFRTAAVAYGPRVIGVVLSGNLDDGTAGLAVVKRHHGIAVVQDPDTAAYAGMPRSAIANISVDYVVRVEEIGPLLAHLARETARAIDRPTDDRTEEEVDMAELDANAMHDLVRPGRASGLGCPECGGALFVLEDGEAVHFRCRVGHAWSPGSLLAAQSDTLENALWVALRALEENAALAADLADRFRARGMPRNAERFEARAGDAQHRAEIIRVALAGGRIAEPDEHDELTDVEGERTSPRRAVGS